VIIFPEGTRSPDGGVLRFTRGAFALAVEAGVPILPLVIEGSSDCLPKESWMFGPPRKVRLHVMPPVATDGLEASDADDLRQELREQIVEQLAKMQGVDPASVDAYTRT
jgi:1-acyl-sn-glycerol-3-phosphate acyltransferase